MNFWYLLAGMALAGMSSAFGADSSRVQGDAAWQNRTKAGETERAISLWDAALKENPGQADLLIKLTEASGRAYRHAATNKEKDHWAELGRRYGEEAIAKNPTNSEAYAQYGAALGQYAQAHKGMHSVKIVRQAIETLKKSLALNPQNPRPHMLLAEIYRHAPHWITKAGKQDALQQARLAARYGGGYALNHLVLAKALIDVGHEPEAVQQLNLALQTKDPEDAVPENQSDKEDARELLRSLGAQPSSLATSESSSSEDACNDRVAGICKDQPAVPGAPQ